MTAEDVKKLLRLVPHPREGGWYVRTYEAAETVAAGAFEDARYASARRTGTAIYYLLEPGTFSEMHRLKSDEVFHFYAGDAVEMLQLMPDGSGRTVVIGNDLAAVAETSGCCGAECLAGLSVGGRRKVGAAGMHGEPWV